MEHGLYAAELFLNGYNCAQAVAIAFCDVTGLDKDFTARMASSFGGGMGRMREVCGAVSGMFMVLGVLYGYDETTEDAQKKQLYKDVQALAEKPITPGYRSWLASSARKSAASSAGRFCAILPRTRIPRPGLPNSMPSGPAPGW